ncbi:hypothetical protein ACFWG5_34675 [Streptomyces hydrogenans]|uniref:hypothetical protein n=1 Tax=Streptomyces TaxID=1883 RepID=UPI00362B3A92
MAAQLKATVFVKDPDTRQTIALAPGTCPEPRLAALVTNPAAWVDGKLPRLRTTQKPEQDPAGDDGPGTDPDPADSGTGSDDDSTPSSEDEQPDDEPTPAKPTRKTAARKPAADQ